MEEPEIDDIYFNSIIGILNMIDILDEIKNAKVVVILQTIDDILYNVLHELIYIIDDITY